VHYEKRRGREEKRGEEERRGEFYRYSFIYNIILYVMRSSRS